MSTINPHTTRAPGTILTAAIYNADHVNHITNAQALNTDKLEGATPPVVDGQVVLWNGTTGAALKTGGYVPANAATLIVAGGGLLGGGALSTGTVTLQTDGANQAEAEAAATLSKVMSPLRTRNFFDATGQKASQAEAEAAAVDTKWLSPLKWRQAFNHANQKANQAEAQAGANDTKWMSPLRTAEAIAALGQALTVEAAQNFVGTNTNNDTGVLGSKGGLFLVFTSSTASISVSSNGGSNFTSFPSSMNGVEDQNTAYLLAVRGGQAAAVRLVGFTVVSGVNALISSIALTPGAGNIILRNSGTTTTGGRIRLM